MRSRDDKNNVLPENLRDKLAKAIDGFGHKHINRIAKALGLEGHRPRHFNRMAQGEWSLSSEEFKNAQSGLSRLELDRI